MNQNSQNKPAVAAAEQLHPGSEPKTDSTPTEPKGEDKSCAPSAARKTPDAVQAEVAAKVVPFTPVDDVVFDPNTWAIQGLIRTVGVTLFVVPPGACASALRSFFSNYLAGRVGGPFVKTSSPGNVLVSSFDPHGDQSLRVSQMIPYQTTTKVFTRTTTSRFNWKVPDISLKGELKDKKPGELAAVIVDAGPLPRRVDEFVVEAAYRRLSELARAAACQLIVMVEASSRHADPYERVPRSLRLLHGTVLVVPLRSKALTPAPGTPPEFLLMRLADAAPTAITARFSLQPIWDSALSKLAEGSIIRWDQVSEEDPREAFRQADVADLTEGQRAAVRCAVRLLSNGPRMTSVELQTEGKRAGIPTTTMRDALTAAYLYGHLNKYQDPFDRCWYWTLGPRPVPPAIGTPSF